MPSNINVNNMVMKYSNSLNSQEKHELDTN